jgi:hypothetical protein
MKETNKSKLDLSKINFNVTELHSLFKCLKSLGEIKSLTVKVFNLSLLPYFIDYITSIQNIVEIIVIIDRIEKLHLNDIKFKSDSEMLVLVCNLIEHLITKKDNISKIELALDIYRHLFGILPEEEAVIKSNINFVHSNKMIKKVSYYKLFVTGISEYLFKKKK